MFSEDAVDEPIAAKGYVGGYPWRIDRARIEVEGSAALGNFVEVFTERSDGGVKGHQTNGGVSQWIYGGVDASGKGPVRRR